MLQNNREVVKRSHTGIETQIAQKQYGQKSPKTSRGIMRFNNDVTEGLTASGEETKAKSFINSIERTWTVVPHNWESS